MLLTGLGRSVSRKVLPSVLNARTSAATSISQLHNHAQYQKVKHSEGPLDSQTWQTEWKTAPLATELTVV